MTDEDGAADIRDGQMLLYDHYKHVTSLCLFSLAGGVALADKAQGRWAVMLVAALVMIGGAGVVAFAASAQIVDARLTGKAVTADRGLSRSVPGIFLSIGIGILLYIFTRSLHL